ncbi:SDR family NAD(P)-dependent oxidoreductase [Paeniglutamicibacter cryotolerans]|uniref:2-deoxy-D-gluconate 3-dehydrogenase n=1 Tax=Paeniglutamicibacter cryotolerans TaxID=670079 RepID=A0A839QIM8_9MICC|nr:SDR family oxidoreductase [Paeniglutamicibacter cryotolerans]MBB2995710.1 2-deoxy-D-gluconate 3-dehydrogenase [Paeniglutamicibacter cryotolerans]
MNTTQTQQTDTLACLPSAFSLAGKHILVTGAGRGLGQGMALSVAACGGRVTAISRSTDELNHTAQLAAERGGECHVLPADLSDLAGLEDLVRAAAQNGPIDGIIHAAGVQLRKDAIDITPEDWNFVQTMNLQAPFFLSTAIARLQEDEQRPGSHVFVGSLNSSIGLPRIAPYVATKTGILGVARSLSAEWAASGIRANVIGPGYFRTKLTEDLLAQPEQKARIMGRIPMRRLGDPSDLGGMAVFLLSDAASYITGQLFNVDGGWLGA